MTRTVWTNGDFAAAMVRYVEAHAKYPALRRGGGIESEAFHRGGDNPTALRVWASGSWADARASGGGGAKEFARDVAGMGLVEFMAQWWGGTALIAKALPPKRYLSTIELGRFAGAVCPIGDELAGVEWLESRGMIGALPRLLSQRLASAVPPDARLPGWAHTKIAGWEKQHRIVVGLFDGGGHMRNLHARRVVETVDDIKTASAAGVTTSGLVMADRTARAMLRGDVAPTRVHLTEGIAAFLASAGSPHAVDVAVMGILSGGWCEAHAAKVPDGARVTIDTDDDKAGDGYADHIVSTFCGRSVEIVRQVRRAA